MCVGKSDVRFTPNSDHKSKLPQNAMSALPPKADMCSAKAHVCFGPKADMPSQLNSKGDLAEETFCTPVEARFARVLANQLFNNPPAEPLASRFLHFRTARLGPPEM